MSNRRCVQVVFCLSALASACESDPTPPEPAPGALELTVRTTGHDPDPDGYTVTVDAGSPLTAAINDTVTIPDLDPGSHTVTLAGLADNCTLETPAPLEVTVPGAAGAAANVEITCAAIYTLAFRGDSGVELTNAAGTVRRALVPDQNWWGTDPLAWSPDGRLLAVDKNNDGVLRVWLANLDEGSFSMFSSAGELVAVQRTVGLWSPDGRELMLESMLISNTSPVGLTRYPLDESYPPQGVYGVSLGMTGGVACPGHAKGILWPDWSPDASRIVICEASQVYILSRDGTTKNLLAPGMQPDWSPDGGAIAYVAPVVGNSTLRVIEPDGGNDRQLTAPPTDETDTAPAWSPDGSRVAFMRLDHAPDGSVTSVHAYVVNRDGTDERQLAVLPNSSLVPTWSADGLHLAYSGAGGTYVVNVDGSGFRLVSTHRTLPAQWRP